MTRFRNVLLALAALAVSAGAALGFSALPSAAGPGLDRAGEAAGREVPARPDSAGAPVAPATETEDATEDAAPAAELPDAAAHGAAVSTVATGEDPTPDTNRGEDVSTVARDNHGTATAAERKPADPGQPADAGKPDERGRP